MIVKQFVTLSLVEASEFVFKEQSGSLLCLAFCHPESVGPALP